MSRIVDYMVLEAPLGYPAVESPRIQLQNMVSHQMQDGWQPIGGVATSTRLENGIEKTYYLQAIVKYGNG